MKTIAVANQKGGVGKTSLCVHLAYQLAEQGYKVLFVDCDPQANASLTLNEFSSGIKASQLFEPAKLPVIELGEGNIALIHADPALVNLDRAAMSIIETFMEQLETFAEQFDVCVIDNSPSLSLRTTAGLFAADFVLSPVQVESYSIQGTTSLLQTIIGIRQRKQQGGGDLVFIGMLPNLVNNNSPMHRSNLKELIEAYPQYVMPFKISNRTSIGEALADQMPVWKINKSAAREAAKEMRAALSEVQNRMGLATREVTK
jgi:chromosome partitioning protein